MSEADLGPICDFVAERGGAVDLGVLTSAFPGLKKAQLDPHFAIDMLGDFQHLVRNEEVSSAALAFAGTAKHSKEKKQKRPRADEQDPPPELEQHVLDDISEYLSNAGGAVALGRLTTVFSGLKKRQLEPHFYVASTGRDSDFIVSIDEGLMPSPAALDSEQPPKAKKQKRGQDLFGRAHSQQFSRPPPGKGSVAPAWLGGSKGSIVGLKGGKGAKGGYRSTHPASSMQKAKKAKKDRRDPDAPPPGPLEPEVADNIVEHLHAEGGGQSLGKITTAFPGVKKTQLADLFHIVETGPKGSADPVVFVDLAAAAAAGF